MRKENIILEKCKEYKFKVYFNIYVYPGVWFILNCRCLKENLNNFVVFQDFGKILKDSKA